MSVSDRYAIRHDPNDVLDYSAAWADVLEDAETIDDSSWEVVAGIALLGNSAIDGSPATTKDGTVSNTTTTIWVLSARDGEVRLQNRITTSAERQYDKTLRLWVESA